MVVVHIFILFLEIFFPFPFFFFFFWIKVFFPEHATQNQIFERLGLVVAVVEWFRLLHRWKKNVNIPPYKMNLNTEKKFEKKLKNHFLINFISRFFQGLISVLYSQFDNEAFHHYPEFIFISVVHFFFLSMAFYYHFILLSEKWLWRWWF